MQSTSQFVGKHWIVVLLLAACAGHLVWLVCSYSRPLEPGEIPSERNADFPNTFIRRIHLELTSPNHCVTLTWAGHDGEKQERGPFRSSPGSGWGTNDCNDVVESNCPGSMCTPKGLRKVEGLRDHLREWPECRYVTLIDASRNIGFHSHISVPPFPDSRGCVRMKAHAARLIHDNSIVGKTEILIDGTWTNPLKSREQGAGAGSKAVATKGHENAR